MLLRLTLEHHKVASVCRGNGRTISFQIIVHARAHLLAPADPDKQPPAKNQRDYAKTGEADCVIPRLLQAASRPVLGCPALTKEEQGCAVPVVNSPDAVCAKAARPGRPSHPSCPYLSGSSAGIALHSRGATWYTCMTISSNQVDIGFCTVEPGFGDFCQKRLLMVHFAKVYCTRMMSGLAEIHTHLLRGAGWCQS